MPIVEPASVVKGKPVNLNSLFKNFNHVPVYQRDFVWQGKQVKALWSDLIEHYKLFADHNDDLINVDGYFLGAMVVIEKSENEHDEVVDGQQRLTSLTTIVAICYDLLSSHPNPDGAISSWVSQLSGILAQADSGSYIPKLKFSDQEINTFFFKSIFLCKSKSGKESYWQEDWSKERLSRKKSPFSKMREAILVGYKEMECFLGEVQGVDKKTKRLLSFTRLLVEGVILLRITAMSYTNAYAIFESLNNRGIPLSQSDLIKNEILKLCNQADLDDVAESWQSARQTIESIEIISMPDFVHYSYISRYGHVKANKLYEKVQGVVVDSVSAKRYSEHLEEDAYALEGLTETFRADWIQETTYMLKDIRNVLNIRHCYPYLIAAYRKSADNTQEFRGHVEAVMNFAFRYMKVLEDPLENFSSAIGKGCEMINQGAPIDVIKKHFLSYAPDDIFIKKFEDISFSNAKLAYFTVYYLEKTQLNGAFPNAHGIDQNLEHIMPKTPNVTHWPTILKCKEDNSSLFKEYLWKVGNLIPLPADINKSLKNKSIALKIKDPSGRDYTSGMHDLKSPTTVSSFLKNGEWTYESIDERQKYIAANLALKAWPL